MEELKEDFFNITDEVKSHLKTELQLMKVEVIDHISHHLASILSRVLLIMLGLMSYLLICLSLAFFLGQFMATWLSFGIVALFSILLLLILCVFNNSLIHGPIQDSLIRTLALKFGFK